MQVFRIDASTAVGSDLDGGGARPGLDVGLEIARIVAEAHGGHVAIAPAACGLTAELSVGKVH
jgi:hypothetical protein